MSTPADIPGPGRLLLVDLRRQYEAIRGDVDAAVARVLQSGWFVLGPEVEAFEREFAAYIGVPHAVGVGSGTDAIVLTLRALGIGPGDEVVTPPLTAFPTVAAVLQAGARPVFADVEPVTLTLDPVAAESAVTPRTKALLPVHLYGQCADLEAFEGIARRHGLALIEDACQSHGASVRGRQAGSVGRAGCFSFYPTKNLGCYGDGGLVVTADAALAARLRMLRNYGQSERYVHREKGTNSRLDELQAAVLRAKLPHLEAWNARRREIAAGYVAGIGGGGAVLPREAPGRRHVYHLYAVQHLRRDDLRSRLGASGIETFAHYPVPVHLQEAVRELGGRRGQHPVAEAAAERTLSLPIFPEMTLEEIGRVSDVVRSFRG